MSGIILSKPELRLPFTAAHYRAIGHVIAQWNFIEREINGEIAWLLRRAPNKSQTVNWQSKFAVRVELWRRLARRVYTMRPEEMAAVDRIAGHAIKIKPERDDIAHPTILGGAYARFRRGSLIALADQFGTPEGIEDLARRISAIGADLLKHQANLDTRYRKRC